MILKTFLSPTQVLKEKQLPPILESTGPSWVIKTPIPLYNILGHMENIHWVERILGLTKIYSCKTLSDQEFQIAI